MRKYDDDFKQQTVKKVFDGQSVASISRELGVAESLIHKWKRESFAKGSQSLTEAEFRENAALKKRVKERGLKCTPMSRPKSRLNKVVS